MDPFGTERSHEGSIAGGNKGLDALLSGPPAARSSGWEYIDPKGNVQGRFAAREMVKWADGGFFAADQKVLLTWHIACILSPSAGPLLAEHFSQSQACEVAVEA